jgi:phage-related protein (TIGR01555 family)
MTMMAALGRVASALRLDGWENALTGLGVYGRDKLAYHAPGVVTALPLQTLEYLYYGDPIAGRIVDKVIEDASRQGATIEPPTDTDDAVMERVQGAWDALAPWPAIVEGDRWGRLYGGGYVMIGALDGGEMMMPLVPERVRGIAYLTVLDAQEVRPGRIYSDPMAPEYGTPETYVVSPSTIGSTTTVEVHASRLLAFGGAPTSRRCRASLQYRDYSVLQRPFDALRRFDSDWRSASAMMADGSQGVLKIRGFADIISGGSKGVFETRMEIVNLCRTVSRIMPIDADDEEFSYVERSWAGVADLLDKTTLYLAAACGMPVTVLFGRSPAGMDATGEGDRIAWYDTVQHHRESVLVPAAETMLSLVCYSVGVDPAGWHVTCPPLLQETADSLATRRKVVAETDAIYVGSGVLAPEEVALARFPASGWSDAAPAVDAASAEALLEMDRERALAGEVEPAAPPPPVSTPPVSTPPVEE